MSITGLMKRLLLIGIDAIWQLSLGCLLMSKLPTLYWLPNFINGHISRILLLILVHVQLLSCLNFFTSCLTAIKNHVIKYCTTVYERNGKKLFWSFKNSGEILNRLKVNKVAKIRNRYNQVPHLTQDTNGKVTNSQKTPQTRAERSALSQQVTTKHI